MAWPFKLPVSDGQGGHWLKMDRKIREEAGGVRRATSSRWKIAPRWQRSRNLRVPAGSAEGSHGCPAGGTEGVVGHHAHRTPRLDSLDRLRQASKDAHASDQNCLRHACQRKATPVLLRSVWDVYDKSLSSPRSRRHVKVTPGANEAGSFRPSAALCRASGAVRLPVSGKMRGPRRRIRSPTTR